MRLGTAHEADYPRHGEGPCFGDHVRKRPSRNRKTWKIILGEENVI
jgi:hypothetical protein